MTTQTIDEALSNIPKNYRIYTVDASILGRYSVSITLKGEERDLWFLSGEVLDKTGKDIRPNLYVSGTGKSLALAITDAIKNITGN